MVTGPAMGLPYKMFQQTLNCKVFIGIFLSHSMTILGRPIKQGRHQINHSCVHCAD